ncbi:MAG: PIN domain-containing protein [Nitrosomonadales bacterium]|nr:PIN domain-containing protein [Nitrosomonadales bacterium]
MKYLLDANVLMHFANDDRKCAKIEKHIERVGAVNVMVSTVTLYELHTKLIKAKVSPANVRALASAVGVFAVKNFNSGAALAAAKVRAELENIGDGIGHPDQMLAGHAKFEKAVLVTNNTRHLSKVHGLQIEDWTA